MSSESYRRWDGKISRKGEDVFRNADAALIQSELLAVDLTVDESIPIPEPELQTEEHYPVGGGRNLSTLSELGFDVPEDTIPLMIQSAVQLYHALGACVTTGSQLKIPIEPAFSDIIASGQGTVIVTMTTHGAMTPDEHAGKQFNDLTALISYTIISNTADTITLDVASEVDADGNSCSVSTTFADTIASGQGTASVVLTTHTSMTINEHAGRMMENATSGINYAIISNTANTLVLHKASSAAADGDTIAITEAPFIHTITEKNSIPSQAFHFELENTVDAESMRSDLLGVLMNTLEHIFEKKADGQQNLGVLVGKSVAGSDLTQPNNKSELSLSWIHASTFTLSYNSANPITADECDSVVIKIMNNALIRPGMGDENAKKPVTGIREYDLILHIFPENDTLKLLRNTKLSSYITDLAFVFKVMDPNLVTHYIQYTFNKLRVSNYKHAIPGKGDAERGLDCGFRLYPGGTLAAIASDSLNILHYER